MGSQNPDFFHIGEGINFSIQVAKNPRNYFLKILKNFLQSRTFLFRNVGVLIADNVYMKFSAKNL